MPSIGGIVRVFEAYGFYQLNKNALHQDYKGQVMSKGTGMGWFGGIVRGGVIYLGPFQLHFLTFSCYKFTYKYENQFTFK